jgi:hypothetical protein
MVFSFLSGWFTDLSDNNLLWYSYIIIAKFFFQKCMTSRVRPTGLRKASTQPKKPDRIGSIPGMASRDFDTVNKSKNGS